MADHLPGCAGARRESELCPRPHELSDGQHHWWSGWPNAYCAGCGAIDPATECSSDCACFCHKDKAYEDGFVVGVLKDIIQR